MKVLGYEIIDTLYQSDKTIIWLGQDNSSGKEVVLKTIGKATSDSEADAKIKYEYDLLVKLGKNNIKGLPTNNRIEQYQGKSILIREYIRGTSLKTYLKENIFSLEKFLKTALQITEILEKIHQNLMIHKDINSNNIIYDPHSEQCHIIDFGIAANIDLKTQHLGNPKGLEGTLDYISPEQTGRMNRVVDYRSDLYSFGVVLYEMICNALPFQYDDPLELIHAHIARQAIPIKQYRENIHHIIQKLIFKLLAKNAEERYQSAYGLRKDLEKLYDVARRDSPFYNFDLGTEDAPLKFQIPEKLYGRKKELDTLLESFEKVGQGNTMIFTVKGEPGVGKSALIAEIYKPITASKGIFIDGKFDQFQKNVPYFAWQQAFRKLTEILLTESIDALKSWKEKILKAVGANAKILINLSPNLELVLGSQPDLGALDATETENRFNYTMKQFIKVLAQAEHPLVIFIDDWQWADNASIQLLETVFQDVDIRYLMLIASYRDNEVDGVHPFAKFEENILANSSEELQKTVKLNNLKLEDISELLEETLKEDKTKVAQLSELVFEKTQGNAFFVNQLLKTLYEEKLLSLQYDSSGYHWSWDFTGIQALNITENVVKFMMNKIQRIPNETKDTLMIAACVGSYFTLKTIASVYQRPLKETYQILWAGMQEGLIIPVDTAKRMHSQFRFVHDRIQQAFYEIISSEERAKKHYQIVQVLLKTYSEKDYLNHIFDISNQYDAAISEIQNQEEKDKVAYYNLLASQQARLSAAYEPALNYAHTAKSLLASNSWDNNYENTFKIYLEILENTYLTGNYEGIYEYIDTLEKNTKTTLDQVLVKEVQLNIYQSENRLLESFELGMKICQMLDIKFKKEKTINIILESLKAKSKVKLKNVENILQRPETKDPLKIAVERILVNIGGVAYFTRPKFIPILVAKQIEVLSKNGLTIYSPYSYMSFALMLVAGFNDIHNAYKLAETAEKLKHTLKSKKIEARIDFVHNSFVKHWKEPLAKVGDNLIKVHQNALENGDFEFSGFSQVMGYICYVVAGKPLGKLVEDMQMSIEVMRDKLKHLATHTQMLTILQPIAKLSQQEENILTYDKTAFVYDDFVKNLEESNSIAFLSAIHIGNAYVDYILGNYIEAEKHISFFEENIQASIGTPWTSFFYMLHALILGKRYHTVSAKQQTKYLKKIKKAGKKLKKWQEYSQGNFAHRYQLVLATQYLVQGKKEDAKKSYNQAVQYAKEYNGLGEEAIILELLATFYEQEEDRILAEYMLQNAYQVYTKWGAKAKIEQLEEKYPKIFNNNQSTTTSITTSSTSTTGGQKNNTLDLMSIIKSSQTISGEIVLGNLIENMLDLVLENAGAERGVLLLKNNYDKLIIQAEIDLEKNLRNFFQNIDFSNNKEIALPASILNYVMRTEETLVLNNATQNEQFRQHPYIQEYKPQSVLCMPLLQQGKMVGLLYLEHKKATNVFIPERTQVLQLLSSQIAISVENATLYEDLEEKVRIRTTEVRKQKDMLEKQKNEIEHKNKNITASINYAQNIQRAMLLPEQEVSRILPHSFILFRPRDVVSGDFYWVREQDNKILISAIDCTGHGVPGALMSMIGNSLLDELLTKKQITSPDVLLTELNLSVKKALRQQETKNSDGMDMTIVVIDKTAQKLLFAGAKNPLVYIQNNKLEIIKGDKTPIGGDWDRYQQDRIFTKHELELNQNGQVIDTCFYIFSDGFQDQFGGSKNKKFSNKRLREVLFANHKEDFITQKQLLEEVLNDWIHQGKDKQVDDILLIGGKVNKTTFK